MTLADLITLFREEAADKAQPYLWSDATLKLYANEAQQEACRRGPHLIDSSSAFCTIAYTAGPGLVTLDPRIINVQRVRCDLYFPQLPMLTASEMDKRRPGWELHTGPVPLLVVSDYETGKLRIYPSPTQGSNLRLTVRRLPLQAMSADTDAPEIRPEYHPALVQWMLFRAYSKQDTETCDPAKADRSLARFEAEFGKRTSARNEAWMRERHDADIDPLA